MSKENAQTKQFNINDNEEKSFLKHKLWNYSDTSATAQQNQHRICCSPVNDIETMGKENENFNGTHSVEVQTDKSTLFLLKQDKRIDNSKKNSTQNINNKEFLDVKKHFLDISKSKQTNEFENVKLKKTKLSFDHEKITAKLAAKINTPEVLEAYAETDLDQPMDYALCYNETNLDEEKKENTPYITKNEFMCIEEAAEEEKIEIIKPKAIFTKEPTRNRKEMFSNPSKSFKEIFNFFKDRDKKRSVENSKATILESPKQVKTQTESCEQKNEKLPQSVQLPGEQSDKETKSKNEAQCSQQTPLMFSRCSSLGSLNGFEQNSINDDRSSIISDFSRRTSGVVSPSELPDSPAQTASNNKLQQKSQIGCFGRKKIQLLQQDKLKIYPYPINMNDNSCLPNESNCKIPLIAKRSVFEDNITSFKDESTPTKLHSMAASSLSSLTIDDDDDYELINKIILNKEKQNTTEDTKEKVQNDRQDPIGESKTLIDSSKKPEKIEVISEDENVNEEDDELTDLTPYEEQLLDECIRRGIAKWTKQNINEIKPFSWDIGLTCLATRTMLTNKIRINSRLNVQNTVIKKQKPHKKNENITNNNLIPQDKIKDNNCEKYLNKDSDPSESVSNTEETNDQFDENSYFTTYEEHLLDECIRRGMAKITKKNINNIKPFSWDTNQICLTTRAMILRGRDENIHGSY